MRKYRNNTRTTLAIDCLVKTVYLRPGEIATLPETRDVRYYAGIRHLIRVKEPKIQSKKLDVMVLVDKYKKPKKTKQNEDNGE